MKLRWQSQFLTTIGMPTYRFRLCAKYAQYGHDSLASSLYNPTELRSSNIISMSTADKNPKNVVQNLRQ